MIFMGIDPGLTGAVGVVNEHGDFVACVDLPTKSKPTTAARVKRELDAVAFHRQLHSIIRNNQKGLAVIESVSSRPHQGVASTFSLGDSFGVLRGVLSVSPLAVDCVVPTVWKRAFDLLGQSKQAARVLAQRLYPEASLKRQKDHNRADALLLARYGWLKNNRKLDKTRPF